MTSKEFFVFTIKDEMPRFERIFKAVKGIAHEEWKYKPHPKSRSTEELIKHTFGSEVAILPIFLEKGSVDSSDFEKVMAPSAIDAMDHFMGQMQYTKEMVEKMSEADWDSKSTMTMDGKSVWEATRGEMAWSFLFDLIHHRGQLSTHLRPMGGTVPAIYGPSGDEMDM